MLFDPRRGDGGTRSGAEEAVGWGWDPPEATRSAIFRDLDPGMPGCGAVWWSRDSIDASRSQDAESPPPKGEAG